jgi:hypothetical protein
VAACQGGRLVVHFTNRKNAPFLFSTRTGTRPPFIAEIVNTARPGRGTYVGLDASDHGFRKTTSVEDSFKRWNTPGGEFNPLIITTLTEWMEKVRIANK